MTLSDLDAIEQHAKRVIEDSVRCGYGPNSLAAEILRLTPIVRAAIEWNRARSAHGVAEFGIACERLRDSVDRSTP